MLFHCMRAVSVDSSADELVVLAMARLHRTTRTKQARGPAISGYILPNPRIYGESDGGSIDCLFG